LRFKRHTSNPDPLYWDERGFTWGLLFPLPDPSVHSPSEDIEDEDEDIGDEDMDDEMVETDPDFLLPEEDRLRLLDLRRRQAESEARSEKLWKDLEDFHGWTDRGRHAFNLSRHGNLGRRDPPWENITRVSRDLYLRHVYPTV
jgi:hypothetical protein